MMAFPSHHFWFSTSQLTPLSKALGPGAKECKLSLVRSIGDNDFLSVIPWACWYYHPLLVLVHYPLSYVAI